MNKDNTVDFETYKKTHDLQRAELKRRMHNWQVKALCEFLAKGKIDDAYDLLYAGLMVEQNRTTDEIRIKFSNVLKDAGEMGYEKEEQELRWRLQKYLKLKGDTK